MNFAPRTGQEAYPTMQAEHWQQIEDLYQAAVAQPPEKRAEFIEQACPGDPQLRAEVESRDAMIYAGAVAHLAQAANHHPDIAISWNKVTLTLSTHSAGGLTRADFSLASQISALP